MATILETIAANSRLLVEKDKETLPLPVLAAQAEGMPSDTGFPFEKALSGSEMAFICECKKASPSKGLIAPEFPYLSIAREYEAAGAAAVSVLTEPKWFLGSKQYLREIAEAVAIPCLRKDFVVDDYQIYEAKVLGAAAVLLICAITDAQTLAHRITLCDRLGLTALVEAHDEGEIRTAVAAGARVLGVNNRNLHDFTVDIRNSERLRRFAPPEVKFIAESGIQTTADIAVLRTGGVNGVLIGETLMRAADKKKMLDTLRGAV